MTRARFENYTTAYVAGIAQLTKYREHTHRHLNDLRRSHTKPAMWINHAGEWQA